AVDVQEKPVPPPQRSLLQTIMIVLAIAAGAFVLYEIARVILALVLAIFFAYLIAPIVFFVERLLYKTRLPRSIARASAIGIVYLGTIAIISVTALILVPRLTEQATDIASKTPEYL